MTGGVLGGTNKNDKIKKKALQTTLLQSTWEITSVQQAKKQIRVYVQGALPDYQGLEKCNSYHTLRRHTRAHTHYID